jgi:ATP-dependent Clp endopeptidase proteolytic subunit ClpP
MLVFGGNAPHRPADRPDREPDRPEPEARTRPETYIGRTHASVDTAERLIDSAVSQRLLDQRIIFLGQEIDDRLANRVCAELLLLAARDERRDITIYINSPGGVVDAGMAIYDMMQFVPNDVSTVAMGLAASMGQTLLCAGTRGKRYALRHARVMMHQPHGGIGGTASDIKIQAEQSLYLKTVLAERHAFHTGRTLAEIQADSDRDRWFTAEQAREYGIVDHVIESTDRVGS